MALSGMDLSLAYFESFGESLIEQFPEVKERVAVGLVGEGSDRFGYDDEISQDHDFGPCFCIWMGDEDWKRWGRGLQIAYESLPQSFAGFAVPSQGTGFVRRHGVLSRDAFYRQFTGSPSGPRTDRDWLAVPQTYLATATNGKVFEDYDGVFSDVRRRLLSYYPESVRRKKIAAHLARMAQDGQYNHLRALRRGDKGSAFLARSRFVQETLEVCFLLSRQYMPFYKWAFRKLGAISQWSGVSRTLNNIIDGDTSQEAIEKACTIVAYEVSAQGLGSTKGDFLLDLATSVQNGIENEVMRSLPLLQG